MFSRILTHALFVAALLGSSAFAANSAFVQTPLVSTGVDADAQGAVLSNLTLSRSEVLVRVGLLAPAAAHEIEVGGVVEASFKTDAQGRAAVRFRTGSRGDRALDFDPRGKLLRVLAGGQSVLEAAISASGEPAKANVSERVNLPAAAAGIAGRARAGYRATPNGKKIFRVDLERAGSGPFQLFVGGIKRGDFTVAGVTARLKFGVGTDDAGVLPLDFDPRGQTIDVASGETLLFSGEFRARARGVNVAQPRFSGSGLTSTGADADGHAEAKLRIDDRARKHFSVEIEDVPAGSYELLVNGEVAGTIVVVAVTGGTKGEIEFTAGDDDPDELPLTFDPAGKTLTIRQGATVFFESVFTPQTGTGVGTPRPEAASELEELLSSTGLDGDGKGRARYRVDNNGRHRFDVEVEDVPVGAYALTVGGVARGSLQVTSTAEGVQGELEFSTRPDPDERPLNFDPRGQLIEIRAAAGTYFSHLLGSGSATPGSGGGGQPAFETEVPLFSTGVDANATAKAELKRDFDGDLSFEVEVEDVAAGAYELVVGGTVRGTVQVVADNSSTRGQLEFESEPQPGRPLLDFAVPGEEIVVRQGQVIYFSRVFPQP